MRISGSAETDASRSPANLLHMMRLGQSEGFILLMKQYNRLLYRIARGILNNNADAEDVVQETYLKLFSHLNNIENPSALKSWLARTATNEALGRLRRNHHDIPLDSITGEVTEKGNVIHLHPVLSDDNPELTVTRREMLHLVETMVGNMPLTYRSVFMMRAIEGLTVDETAHCLGISPETVKTRYHRARKILQQELNQIASDVLSDVFSFDGTRCDRIIATVLETLAKRT